MEAPRPALAVSTYGSDKDGLACSYLFGLPQAGRTIDAEEAVAWLRAPAPASAFLWLHFNVSNAAADRFMQQHLAPSEGFQESLTRAVARRGSSSPATG